MIIPIRTQMVFRRTPTANYAIIGVNCFVYLIFNWADRTDLIAFMDRHLVLQADGPSLYQFLTYQFLHAGPWHLAGNMLFLWVFGNSVNAKMGNWPFLFFYLAGGVFAALAFTIGSSASLLGASGSIAAITTAYLVLFPRSRVTVMYMLFFIGFFELPAMILILFKIILWDNMIAPGMFGSGQIATSAHLGGYLFGFFGALIMLAIRAVARDQFDMLSLINRWNRKRAFQATMTDPAARRRAEIGSVARTPAQSEEAMKDEEQQMDQISDLRTKIGECLTREDAPAAATLYEQLVAVDSHQCLSAKNQLTIAREFYATNRSPQAAGAFERFLACYPNGGEANEVRLLVGIIYARDLKLYERAEGFLTKTLPRLAEGSRKEQCLSWLEEVRQALGKPAADA